jgi:hypothetical protein
MPGNDENERSIYDGFAGKERGETYQESYNRKSEEFRKQQNQEARENAARKEADDAKRVPNPYPSSTQKRAKASLGARLAMIVGWISLIFSLFSIGNGYVQTPLGTFSISITALVVGIVALALGYAAEKVAGLIGLGCVIMVYVNGRTPEGFEFGAVPLKIWLFAVIALIGGFLVSRLFRRD